MKFALVGQMVASSQAGFHLVVICPHPGDTTPLEDYYNPVCRNAATNIRIVTKEQMSGPDLLPGVDLVFESASTIGIEAVCQRIPVVDWFSEIGLERLTKATGSSTWPLCAQGSSFLYKDSDDLDVVRSMANGTAADYQRLVDELYPKPTRKGIALEKILEEIERVAVLTH
jgi:hypothetical protein